MFGTNGSEFLLIILLAIIFIKPEDLPSIIRQAGHWYGRIVRVYYAVLDEIRDMSDLGGPGSFRR